MNKKDMNRKIQLLEEKVNQLEDYAKKIVYCECDECTKKRKEKYEQTMNSMKELNLKLDKYYYGMK